MTSPNSSNTILGSDNVINESRYMMLNESNIGSFLIESCTTQFRNNIGDISHQVDVKYIGDNIGSSFHHMDEVQKNIKNGTNNCPQKRTKLKGRKKRRQKSAKPDSFYITK